METKTLQVNIILPGTNGECLRCIERLKESLLDVRGIEAVEGDTSILYLKVNPFIIPMEKIEETAKRVGIEIAERFVHETLQLTGLDCMDCAEKIEGILSRMEGVVWVNVNFTTGKMRVEYDSHRIELRRVLLKIEELGYGVKKELRKGPKTTIFHISGMDCAKEASRLEKEISRLEGIKEYRIDLMGARLIVRHITDELPIKAILDAVDRAGLKARIEGEERIEPFWRTNKRLLTTIASGILLVSGFILQVLGFSKTLVIPVYASSIIIGGYTIARSGLIAAKHISLDMNFLMTIAVIGAGIIGEWLEGAAVTFLFATAQLLESFSMERARRAITSLIDISPKHALVVRDNKEVYLPVNKITVGDIIIVKPGERIALDGKIIKGSSTINQAPITGESVPVEKRPGDDVFAGTINMEGSLHIEVTHSAKDTTLSKIIHMVEEAQAMKAPTQSFVDRFARYYTPSAIIGAVLVMIIPPLFFAHSFVTWFYRGLVILVIACPCALVISTPVSIVSGLAAAAKKGVLIKGGVYLEEVGHLRAIAFDKTGTLTRGEFEVSDIIPLNGVVDEDILRIAASVEARSEHPIGRAIMKKASERGIKVMAGSGFRSISGKGAWAEVDGRVYYVGNHRLFDEMKLCNPVLEEKLVLLEQEGKTVVLLGDERHVLGFITFSDVVREEGVLAIKELSNEGIEHMVMLTGDNALTADVVAMRLGIKEYRAELLPQDKVNVIKELKRRYGKVGAVGDGVNDAPALALATVGIAMGVAGTDVALETADIALMSDDLSRLPFLYALSRRTLKVIKANIVLALAFKAIFLALAVPGFATLWMAVVADMGASLIVIFNGLRLLRA